MYPNIYINIVWYRSVKLTLFSEWINLSLVTVSSPHCHQSPVELITTELSPGWDILISICVSLKTNKYEFQAAAAPKNYANTVQTSSAESLTECLLGKSAEKNGNLQQNNARPPQWGLWWSYSFSKPSLSLECVDFWEMLFTGSKPGKKYLKEQKSLQKKSSVLRVELTLRLNVRRSSAVPADRSHADGTQWLVPRTPSCWRKWEGCCFLPGWWEPSCHPHSARQRNPEESSATQRNPIKTDKCDSAHIMFHWWNVVGGITTKMSCMCVPGLFVYTSRIRVSNRIPDNHI